MNKHIAVVLTLFLLAVASVGGQEYSDSLETTKATAYNPAEMLRGRISGARASSLDGNVNGETFLNIRGLNTLRGDSQPLWIVDGAILTAAGNQNADAFWQYDEMSYSSTLNTLAFLSAYDIESIEVIKDLSAAAIWGGNAANGVVVIKTRKPQETERLISYTGNAVVGVSNVNADIFTPSVSHNHSFSISGSQKGSSYRISAYYRDVDGVAVNQGANYGGASINFESRANSALWFGFHSILSKGSMDNTTGPAYFGQPSLLMLGRAPHLFPRNSESGWARDYDDKAADNRTVNSMFLTFNFTQKLSLNLKVGADYRSLIRKLWFGNGTSFGYEMNGAAAILNSSLFNYNGSADLSYKTFFGGGSSLNISAGIDGFGYVNRFNTMNGFDFFTHALRAEGLSLMKSHADIYSQDCSYGRVGAFASAAYDLKGLFTFDAMFRGERAPAYDCFGTSLYPAANASVNLKKIALGSVDAVSSAKLTAGYGAGGREYQVPCNQLDVWLAAKHPFFAVGQDCYVEGFDLVRSAEFNTGVSLGLFKDRLSMSVKYFMKNTTDKFYIFDSSNVDESGFFVWSDRKEVFFSSASIANRGLEFDLSAIPVSSGTVKWTVAMNFTACANQVTAMNAEETFGHKVGDDMLVNANAVGYQLGQLYGYLENPDGTYRDMNSDGAISVSDKRLLGNTSPKYYGGLSSILQAGKFSFDMLIDGAAGQYVGNLNALVLDRKTDLSESYVEKAGFLRLSHLAFTWDAPLKSRIVRSMKLTLAAQNLLTLTNYSGWNPDVNCFGRNVFSQGLDYGSYPVTRNFTFGINLNF